MKKIALLLSLFSISFPAFCQDTSTEKQLIKKTIELYFDGWATGDTTKLGKAMHASCHLKNYRDGKFTVYTREQYLSFFKPRPVPPNLQTRIISLDVTNNMGSAKVEISTEKDLFTDYFNLMKTDEGWVIADKVSTRTPHITGDACTAAGRRVDSLFAVYNSQTPGAAVAIVKDGKVVFQKGYGMADLEHDIPITPQTVFNVASVSKQFTAFATYLLASEGRISLEDDVRKYIPELPDYGHVIKIKHLLGHTSGLRDQAAIWSLAGSISGDISTTEQTLKLLARQRNLNFTPGTAFGYCNTGYTLLAEIIHRVSGQSFATYTAEKIFRPLGMTSTQFCDNYGKVVKNKAESYELINGIYYHQPLNVSNPGPSNLLTTVEDLTRWILNFEHPVVGTPALIKAFNEASYLDNGSKVILRIAGDHDTIFHAKGQNLSNYKGVEMITHGGHAAAFRTFMGRFPHEQLAIIALSNDEHNERLNARWQMAEFYIKDKLKEESSSPAASRPPVLKPTVEYTGDVKDFGGEYYSDELGTSYTFIPRGNVLVMRHLRLDDIVLKREGEGKFSGAGPETFAFEMAFEKDEKGGVKGFVISNFGVKGLRFEKVR
ncbi:CubicO group peptidase, beta-lactamase class C family [Chitinophaga sp. YR627]|uniref:serine hydrolase n=1 Tax=Chitinophaga sp. YR627 TaxID=1881041 RepID=UPI0008E5CFFA|nr:serine hydrolase [Chitinophaga sp. YR627]SFN74659.1 CubicO group peptidase, beta-lactamase class C family [Chitinophaga sp. YR627]